MAITIDGTLWEVDLGLTCTVGERPTATNQGDWVWTDVTAYAERVEWSRGRSTELGEFQAGRASVRLSNDDQRFDPQNAAGPYAPNLLPRKGLRILAQYPAGVALSYDDADIYDGSDAYDGLVPVFTGTVNAWPPVYDYPARGTVTVTASDALRDLAAAGTTPDQIDELFAQPEFTSFLRFYNGAPRYSNGEIVTGYRPGPRRTSPPAELVSSLIPNRTDPAERFFHADDDERNAYWYDRPDPWPPGINFPAFIGGSNRVGAWIKITETTPTNGQVGGIMSSWLSVPDGGAIEFLHISVRYRLAALAWELKAFAIDVADNPLWDTTVEVTPNVPHLVIVQANWGDAGGASLWLDGVSIAPTGTAVWDLNDAKSGARDSFVGYSVKSGYVSAGNLDAADYFPGDIDEAHIGESALTAAGVAKLTAAGVGLYGLGETLGVRARRLLDLADFDYWRRDIASGSSPLAVMRANTTILGEMRAATEAEAGRLFVNGHGAVVVQDRTSVGHDAAGGPYLTLGPAGSTEPSFTDIDVGFDDTEITNRVTVSTTGGDYTAVAENASSIDRYGLAPEDLELAVVNDADALGPAQWRLIYAEPFTRYRSVTLKPKGDPARLMLPAIGSEIGRFVRTRLSPPASVVTTADDFTRANSTSSAGPLWANIAGTWGVSTNKAYVAALSGGRNMATAALGHPTQKIVATLSGTGADLNGSGVVVCAIDANNYISIRWVNAFSTWNVEEVVGGVATFRTNTGATSALVPIGLEYDAAKGTLTPWYNGAARPTLTALNPALWNSSSSAGLIAGTAPGTSRWDDVTITSPRPIITVDHVIEGVAGSFDLNEGLKVKLQLSPLDRSAAALVDNAQVAVVGTARVGF